MLLEIEVKLCSNTRSLGSGRSPPGQIDPLFARLIFGIKAVSPFRFPATTQLRPKHLEERFTEAGIACEYVHGNVPMFAREDMFERFRSGETKIISSVGHFSRLT